MKPFKAIMIQGTGSSCGKSLITTALCRIFKEDSYKVAPYKSQNMALNSFVTLEGGEMARAQVVQAMAAGIRPHTDMNPILMKPVEDELAQIIVQGKALSNMSVGKYIKAKKDIFKKAKESFDRLKNKSEVIVIEGAGSPAEINLRSHDIANMEIAFYANAPVIIVADIDKGGVFASLIGTLALLSKRERNYVKGFIINKFRGNLKLLKGGLDFLEKRTGKKVLGVVPYIKDLRIPDEDAISFDKLIYSGDLRKKIDIAIIHLPHIADISDYEPLLSEIDVLVRYVRDPRDLGRPDILIIPGTKSTIGDLGYIKSIGFKEAILNLSKLGTEIIGICGGFQMLGKAIKDDLKVESKNTFCEGLGLLDIKTYFKPDKITKQLEGIHLDSGLSVKGYEIHMGRSTYNNQKPIFKFKKGYYDGTSNELGNVWGTYLHGVFNNNEFRNSLLDRIRKNKKLDRTASPAAMYDPEKEIDRFASIVRKSLDMKAIYKILKDAI